MTLRECLISGVVALLCCLGQEALGRARVQPSATLASACVLVVRMAWDSTPTTENERRAIRHHVSDKLGELFEEAFSIGGYKANPQAFPMEAFDFQADLGMFHFRKDCNASRALLDQLVKAYANRASTNTKMPRLVVREKPATKFESLCGVGQTKKTCPEADQEPPR